MIWLALAFATALQLLAGIVRVRGWYHVIRVSSPEGSRLRYRDVVRAQLGGCGWNGVLPARAGDAVKLALVRRRMPKTPVAVLAGTLVAPALVDAALTAMLVAGLIAAGLLAPADLTGSLPGASSLLVVAVVAGGCALGAVLLRHVLRRVARDVRAGLAVIGRPRILFTRVASWQLAARALRLLSFALVLVAAGVPFGLAPALLLMALQGASPSVSPAATAARIALLAGLFAGTSDVGAGQIAAVLVTSYAAIGVTNLAVSGGVIALELRTVSPRRIIGYAQTALRPLARTSPAPSA